MTAGEGYPRFPHIHGDLVTFVAEDDIWLAPVDGGRAWRLSADRVLASSPRFSPDGSLIAWSSTRAGTPEIQVAPVDGGPSRRLTHWGAALASVAGWTADGEVLAVSSVGRRDRRHSAAFAVPLDGGRPRELPYGLVSSAAPEPGGERVLLLSANSREPAHWKRYRGGTAGKLWLGVVGGFARVHAELDGQLSAPMWVGERIAFLSDHEGVNQLWSSLPDGSDLRRHSEHESYARNATTDGSRVVYHSAGDLWLVPDLAGSAPRRLELRLGGPATGRQPYPVSAGRYLGAVSPDAEGRSSLVEVRGGIHRVTHRDGPATEVSAAPGVRNRLPKALPDGGSVWVTDAEGDDVLAFSDGRRVPVGQLGRVEELAVAPDGSLIALANREGMVLLVEAGQLRELDRSQYGQCSGLAFSPDSRWLAWSHPSVFPDEGPAQLRLASLADGSVTELTPPRFSDRSPVFSTDGKHLAFLSVRDFDPVYDQHTFDLSFPLACRPYLLTLAADTLSPFGPQPGGRPLGKAAQPETEADAEEAVATRIDLEGLADRIVPFPVPTGRYSSLRAVQGGVVWQHNPLAGPLGNGLATPDADRERSSLERFDFATRRTETLVEALDWFEASGDGSRLAVVDGGALRIVPADRKAAKDDPDDSVPVDLARVRATVDPVAEWTQMFDETARLMRDNFWREDLGGADWTGIQRRYRPLVRRLGSHSDLVDLLWELQGELATSHSYVIPVPAWVDPARRQGLLGADLVRDGDSWRVARVLPGESSDPQARSPLAAPGVNIRAGEALLAVDGRPVDPLTGPAPLLVGTAGRPIELTVAPADGGESRTAVVVPLADEERLRYHDWVAGRRAYVRERSGGRLGYLHVPDMQVAGWAQLHRDLTVEMVKDGLILDTRENRGGHTSQLVIEKLSRRIIGWETVRTFGSASYPVSAPRGPLVSVANEYSASDGDVVNAAFKALGLGPVVGVRTWGGVVGIDSHYSLVDGTSVTQPRYSFWIQGPGWGVENYGVDPDVEVVCTPQDWAAGRDPQLDEAIRIALAELAEHPAATAPPLPEL